MRLTEEQEQRIRLHVVEQGLGIESLQDDLIDHLCCVVESRWKEGADFDSILQTASQELAPNGLKELEHQTLFLLNSNRIIRMKRIMYLIGFLGAFALTVGVTFKLMHWPGANMLNLTGFVMLLLIFVPLLVADRFKVALSGVLSEKFKLIFGLLASLMLGLSVVFKFLHLQGAPFLLIGGAFVFAFGFLPFLFFRMYKQSVA